MNIEGQDDFTQAFEQFSVPEDKKDAETEAAAAATEAANAGQSDDVPADAGAGDSGGADDTVADTGSGEPAATEGATEAAAEGATENTEAAAVETTPEPKVDPKAADDILNRLAQVVAEAKPKTEDKPAEQAEEEQQLYSQDEQEFLASYDKDWSDVVRGEALKRRGEYKELLQYVFSEVSKALQPLREVTDGLADRTFLTDIKANVPDYSDDLREKVIGWVDTQPAYLQAAYKQVIESGTVEEVKDLVDRYRGANGQKADKGSAGQQQPKKDTELSSEAKQAAAALAPVESKRSGVQQPGDPSNFEDAWAQFAKDA